MQNQEKSLSTAGYVSPIGETKAQCYKSYNLMVLGLTRVTLIVFSDYQGHYGGTQSLLAGRYVVLKLKPRSHTCYNLSHLGPHCHILSPFTAMLSLARMYLSQTGITYLLDFFPLIIICQFGLLLLIYRESICCHCNKQ